MHFESLAPLLRIWPLFVVALAVFAALYWYSGHHVRKQRKFMEDYDRRYWAAELAHRAKMLFRSRLFGSKVPRLTYRRATAESEN